MRIPIMVYCSLPDKFSTGNFPLHRSTSTHRIMLIWTHFWFLLGVIMSRPRSSCSARSAESAIVSSGRGTPTFVVSLNRRIAPNNMESHQLPYRSLDFRHKGGTSEAGNATKACEDMKKLPTSTVLNMVKINRGGGQDKVIEEVEELDGRGGADVEAETEAEERARLDAMVEQLIASISSSSSPKEKDEEGGGLGKAEEQGAKQEPVDVESLLTRVGEKFEQKNLGGAGDNSGRSHTGSDGRNESLREARGSRISQDFGELEAPSCNGKIENDVHDDSGNLLGSRNNGLKKGAEKLLSERQMNNEPFGASREGIKRKKSNHVRSKGKMKLTGAKEFEAKDSKKTQAMTDQLAESERRRKPVKEKSAVPATQIKSYRMISSDNANGEKRKDAIGRSIDEGIKSPLVPAEGHEDTFFPLSKSSPGPPLSRRREQITIPPPPPNAVYRLLLQWGRPGHMVILLFVVLFEFIHTYLPTLHSMVVKLFILLGIAVDPRVQEESRFGSSLLSSGRRGSKFSVHDDGSILVSSEGSRGETKSSRRSRTRQADAVALRILSSVGDDFDAARYKHLSVDFMQRHCLGHYAGLNHDIEETKKSGSGDLMDTDAKQVDLKAKLDLDDGSDNGDWIVDGLTLAEDSKLAQEIMKNSNLPLADTSSSARKSFPSSFAIEFGFASKRNKERSEILTSRRRGATLAAAEAAKVSRSMRDFTPSSGGVMRRIRKAANAASGTSFFSNARLLGAYPGDAPSITDAGNASGLMNLATKYGYGEWSDSDRDDEFPWVGRTGSRRKKRRIKRPSYRSSKR